MTTKKLVEQFEKKLEDSKSSQTDPEILAKKILNLGGDHPLPWIFSDACNRSDSGINMRPLNEKQIINILRVLDLDQRQDLLKEVSWQTKILPLQFSAIGREK